MVVDKKLRKKYQASPGKQEWVTAIECVGADGTKIPPMIIFKGENIVNKWLPSNFPAGWVFSCNSKGWSSNEHGVEWLRKCFDPATKEKAKGK